MTNLPKLLASHGLRTTVARIAVLELFNAHVRLTPVDIFRRLDDDRRRISLATIHRVLGELRNAGLVERHYLGEGMASYASARSPASAHFVCRGCGAIASIEDAALARQIRKLAANQRFAIADWTVSLRGVCAACKDA
jgi:Fur family ferric uptake transcriptional regulator